MAEAQGGVGRDKLPQKCRGRHPHLNAFDAECDARPALIMMGASNLWFASTQSIIVMPRTDAEEKEALADRLRVELGVEQVQQFGDQLDVIRALALARNIDMAGITDDDLAAAVADVLAPADSEEERQEKLAAWDPVDLLVPEWRYLQKPSLFPQQQNSSGLMVTEMQRGPELHQRIGRVVAVNQMKKINAVLGFTRLDEMDRVNDLVSRLVKLTRNGKPTWVPATEDRGEGIFLQLDLAAVDGWEQGILASPAVGGPPRGAPTQLLAAVLRDRQARRPRHPPARAAILAAALAVPRADPRDGDVERLRRCRASPSASTDGRPLPARGSGRAADLHDGIRQRRHARWTGRALQRCSEPRAWTSLAVRSACGVSDRCADAMAPIDPGLLYGSLNCCRSPAANEPTDSWIVVSPYPTAGDDRAGVLLWEPGCI